MQALDDNDDYVAALLERDAEKYQNRPSTGAFPASKRRPDAPKPNLRFLKNVLRDVDSHNTALKLKEEEESRAKVQDLLREQCGSKKRERKDDGQPEQRKRHRPDAFEERKGRWKEALQGIGEPKNERRRKQRRSGQDAEDHDREDSSRHHRRHRRRSSRSRTRSPELEKDREPRRRRSRDPRRSRSPKHRSRHDHRNKPSPDRSSAPTLSNRRKKSPRDGANDSDPLEEIIGPRAPPKVKHKGRGAPSTSTAMDAHFRSDYDPKADVSLNADGNDDWDMALEALRDRAKWNAQGAERLKAAGFTDAQVKQWAKGGEKDVEDVVWRKKGEAREWDRGKMLDDNGDVQMSPDGAE